MARGEFDFEPSTIKMSFVRGPESARIFINSVNNSVSGGVEAVNAVAGTTRSNNPNLQLG